MGERVVLPSLLGLGVRQLDQLLLSHADNDHAGGAGAVLRGMPVTRVVSGEPLRLPAALGATACGNQAWEWDGVRLRTWRWEQARSGNDRSCVLSVEAHGERIHLTGDIGVQAEAAWIASGEPLRADWLLAPHHGSASSSSAALIEAVSPRGALITRGSHNAFGHPHPSVVARYRASGVAIHDTAQSGALLIRLGERDEVRGLRTQARFWRENENGDGRRGPDPVLELRHFSRGFATVWELVKAGGWMMLPIILSSIAATAIIVERLWTLRANRIAPPQLLGQVWRMVRTSSSTRRSSGTACIVPLGEILAAGLANSKHGREIMKECIEEAASRVIHELERYLNTLGTIAAMGPLLGLWVPCSG